MSSKILVVQTAFLGDVILSIPLLKALKSYFKPAQMALVCRPGFGEIFLKSGLVTDIIEVNKKNGPSLKAAFNKMKLFAPTMVVSPHRSFRSLMWTLRLQAPSSLGFESFLSDLIFTHTVPYNLAAHDVSRQLSLLGPVVDEDSFRSFDQGKTSLRINIDAGLRFKDLGPFVALAPGSQWNTKRWTFEGYLELGKKLLRDGRKIVIVGAPSEAGLCSKLSQSLEGAVDLCGKTSVFELAQVLRLARLLVCNDSGTMHLAATVGTPVVSIFGPTVTSQGYAPWNEKARVVEVNLSCRPCGAHGHDVCPIGTHECMKAVTPDAVFQACTELLA